MRLGLFGGSFDPVHYGHLLLAECAREALALDEVWLLPAAVPPHKQTRELAPAKARLEMLELALGGHEQIRASALEIERGGEGRCWRARSAASPPGPRESRSAAAAKQGRKAR